MDEKTRIGIIGCGTIGSEIARAVRIKFSDTAKLAALSDSDKSRGLELVKELGLNIPVCLPDEVIELSDLIVEAANASVSKDIATAALVQNKYVLIMSVGGLIDAPEVFQLTRESKGRLYIPSGAIGGIDAVKAAAEGDIKIVRLTTKKSLNILAGAPYIEEKKIDLDAIDSDTVIFEGNVIEAVRGFPKSINVSAALSFAGIGAEETLVRVIASPELTRNVYEIEVEGSFGKLFTRTENVPSPVNQRTSYLAVLSAVAMLRRILYALKVGT